MKTQSKRNEYISLTTKRLYAYPQLKKNIERYKLDIEDIKKETFGKSKSIVVFAHKTGEPLSLEEKRAARIRLLEEKIERDEQETQEIERALEEIKKDEFYPALEMYFFKNMVREKVAEKVHCSGSTVSRQIGRLLNKLSVYWYGAAAIC